MYYLLEAPVGVALFTEEKKMISYYLYESCAEAVETISGLSEDSNKIPENIKLFVDRNIAGVKTLNVLGKNIQDVLQSSYPIEVVSIPDSTFRELRKNQFKHFSMNKNLYNCFSQKIVQKIFCRNLLRKQTESCEKPSEDLSYGKDVDIVKLADTIQELDKSINNRIMRLREWYGLHFPELSSVEDPRDYLNLLLKIRNRKEAIENMEKDEAYRKTIELHGTNIVDLIKNSMGIEMGLKDMDEIVKTAIDIMQCFEQRRVFLEYLKEKCIQLTPNMLEIIDEYVISKLIKKAGSLSKLSKLPSSTIQILGAEKSFSKAMKEGKNLPKHGIIFEAKEVSCAGTENRGKIARLLANYIALCARVDFLQDEKNRGFGRRICEKLRKNIEKIEDRGKKEPKEKKNIRKPTMCVSKYDSSRDAVKKRKVN